MGVRVRLPLETPTECSPKEYEIWIKNEKKEWKEEENPNEIKVCICFFQSL